MAVLNSIPKAQKDLLFLETWSEIVNIV